MTPEQLGAYVVAISGVVTVLVQLIKPWLIDPRMPQGTGRDSAIRLLTIALNFALLLLVLATHNAFVAANLFDYIALAFGQSLLSHGGYQLVSSGGSQPAQPTPPAA